MLIMETKIVCWCGKTCNLLIWRDSNSNLWERLMTNEWLFVIGETRNRSEHNLLANLLAVLPVVRPRSSNFHRAHHLHNAMLICIRDAPILWLRRHTNMAGCRRVAVTLHGKSAHAIMTCEHAGAERCAFIFEENWFVLIRGPFDTSRSVVTFSGIYVKLNSWSTLVYRLGLPRWALGLSRFSLFPEWQGCFAVAMVTGLSAFSG